MISIVPKLPKTMVDKQMERFRNRFDRNIPEVVFFDRSDQSHRNLSFHFDTLPRPTFLQ